MTIPVIAAPPGYPGSPMGMFGAPITIPLTRPYTVPKGIWVILTGPNDEIAMVLSATVTVPLVPTSIASPYVVSDGANIIIQGSGNFTQLVQIGA